MSANEIIAELPKLTRHELEKVDCRVHELLHTSEKNLHTSEEKNVWESLLEIAGSAKGLPEDFAQQHDHYLYGTPKR